MDSFPLERIFERTDPAISSLFQTQGPASTDFPALMKLPTLFLTELTRGVVPAARVGVITQARIVGNMVHLEYFYDPSLPPVAGELLHNSGVQIGINVFTRTHWAVHDADLFRFLARHQRPSRRLPSAFTVNAPERIDRGLCAAMMPFSAPFTPVYAKLQEIAVSLGMECLRADDIWEAQAVIQDIVSLIDRAAVVICDCTGRNPNVFYEIGLAHAFGREIILIAQSADDIPFDLRHIRYLTYHPNAQGIYELGEALRPRLAALRGNP
ncbi:hypothetical protein [Xanthomonas axonopodis]|uniref:hypothetical protein n=1 Tax=Xanthomonas axonopodis TaxID=53413 RepID=UPI001C0DB27A|nr:hypothetical protein [Xanthomonas axonopodis]